MNNPKLTKKMLKSIVKECLIEVLAEGLVSPAVQSSSPSYENKSKTLKESMLNFANQGTKRQSKKKRESHLDSISYGQKKKDAAKSSRLDELANNVTDDPILTEMLADTAHTTLQEQIAAESNKQFVSSGAGDDAQRIVNKNSPEELFGEETSGKWAQLAFGG